MLNFAEQTGSGAVIVVWSFLRKDTFSCYTISAQLRLYFWRETKPFISSSFSNLPSFTPNHLDAHRYAVPP
jgi:hypothetical protein